MKEIPYKKHKTKKNVLVNTMFWQTVGDAGCSTLSRLMINSLILFEICARFSQLFFFTTLPFLPFFLKQMRLFEMISFVLYNL